MSQKKKIHIPSPEEVAQYAGENQPEHQSSPESVPSGRPEPVDKPEEPVTEPQADAPAEEQVSTESASVNEDFKDKYLRIKAEMVNYRRRAENSRIEAVRYANADLVKALLPNLDDLERVIESARQHTDSSEAILNGINLTLENFYKTLESFKVVRIDQDHVPFDPNIHEAMMQQPNDEVPEHTVLQVVLKGYKLHDRVIRPAKVIVSKPSE